MNGDDFHPHRARLDATQDLWYHQMGGFPHEADHIPIIHDMVEQNMQVYFFEAFILLHSYLTRQGFVCYGTQIVSDRFIDITNSSPQETVKRISLYLEGSQFEEERLD
jgi:hypothetical protein